jgi:hypothetical protein
MSGSVLLHRQLSSEDLEQLLAWYKVRDSLLGENRFKQDFKKALELASVCGHPNAVWLTKLFGGRDVASREEARRLFLSCKNDRRALCFAGFLGVDEFEEIRRAAELGDAFAQAWMAWQSDGEESFRWAEESAAQGDRDGIYNLGYCFRVGTGCEQDVERAKENFLVSAELGHVMEQFGVLLEKDDPQRFVWFSRSAANGASGSFWNEMSDHVRNFCSGTGNANVVFVIGRALKGHQQREGDNLWRFLEL